MSLGPAQYTAAAYTPAVALGPAQYAPAAFTPSTALGPAQYIYIAFAPDFAAGAASSGGVEIGTGLAGGATIPGSAIGTGTGAGSAVSSAASIVPGESTGAILSGSTLIPGEAASGGVYLRVFFVSEFHYSPPTGGGISQTSPPRSFSGPVGANAAFPSGFTFSGHTGAHSSSLVPVRGFGGSTGGVTEGLPTPINLTATVLGAGEIGLNWIDPGPEEDGYRVERSLSGMGDWETIGTVVADVVTFEDRFAVPLVVYDYRVIGFDAFRESLPSNIATAVTPLPPDLPVGPPPTAPVDPERNRIEPDYIEFKSPGIYGLEKGPDGDVTGFKF